MTQKNQASQSLPNPVQKYQVNIHIQGGFFTTIEAKSLEDAYDVEFWANYQVGPERYVRIEQDATHREYETTASDYWDALAEAIYQAQERS